VRGRAARAHLEGAGDPARAVGRAGGAGPLRPSSRQRPAAAGAARQGRTARRPVRPLRAGRRPACAHGGDPPGDGGHHRPAGADPGRAASGPALRHGAGRLGQAEAGRAAVEVEAGHMTRATIYGAGSWATAFAQVLADAGAERVTLWARREEVATAIRDEHRNPDYLGALGLPPALT